jgi:hypothetical protein
MLPLLLLYLLFSSLAYSKPIITHKGSALSIQNHLVSFRGKERNEYSLRTLACLPFHKYCCGSGLSLKSLGDINRNIPIGAPFSRGEQTIDSPHVGGFGFTKQFCERLVVQ